MNQTSTELQALYQDFDHIYAAYTGDEVLTALQERLVACREAGSASLLAACLNELAGAYRLRAHYSEAAQLYLELISLLARLDASELDKANALLNMGSLAHAAGSYEQAAALYDQAIEMVNASSKGLSSFLEHADETSCYTLLALYNNRSANNKSRGLYEAALNDLSRASFLLEHMQTKFHKDLSRQYMLSTVNAAEVLLKLKKYDTAFKLIVPQLQAFLGTPNKDDFHYSFLFAVTAELAYLKGLYQLSLFWYDWAIRLQVQAFGSSAPCLELLRKNRQQVQDLIAGIKTDE